MRQEAEGQSTDSSGSSSSNSFGLNNEEESKEATGEVRGEEEDTKVKEGKEVN